MSISLFAQSNENSPKYNFSYLDRKVQAWVDSGYYTGASILIAKNNLVIHEKYFGSYTPGSAAYIASAGKWLAAATIAAVVDEGKLSWDDKVSKWLPEFKDIKGKATLRQLLSHTAGYPDYQPEGRHRDNYQTLKESVAHIVNLPADTLPGTKFKYGGLAMQVAGRIAELATGKDWETIFQEKIARPLQMKLTHFTPVSEVDGQSPMLGGGARAGLEDYGNFLNMIINDGVFKGKRILSVKSIYEMQANQVGEAKVAPGEFVEKARASKRKDIYGLGEWREEVDVQGNPVLISSPSWAGAYPWIDKKNHVYGFFLARVATNKNGFNPFLASPVLPLLVRDVLDVDYNPISKVWVADQGNGTYKNPVLYADYSDPDAIRVGDNYYLVSSSFNCMPGLPVLQSKDLVNWKLINYALNRQEPAAVYDQPQHGKGVWAPCIRYHKGEFYIYYPDPDFGIYMVKAKDPAGKWSKPILVLQGKGIIDPTPIWDEDGKAYLGIGWAGSRAGVNSLITVFTMNSEGTKVTDDGKHVYDGHDHNHTIEGPKFYKRKGYYYILAPAGGVTTGWQLALRSKHIYGPYEAKVVMNQGSTTVNGPHQGALVETQTGEPWFIHFQDKGAYGRIVYLEPVKWVNNWPVIGKDDDGDGTGEPVSVYKKPSTGKNHPIETPAESDEFNTDKPGLQWQWNANPKIQWGAQIKGSGFLRLFAYPQDKNTVNLWTTPNLLLQKLSAPDFTATTKVDYKVEWGIWQGKKAGLLIMGNDYSYLAIAKDEKGFKVSQVICKGVLNGNAEEIIAEDRIGQSTVYLRVYVSGPDARCSFTYSEDGMNFKKIGVPFIAQPDKWIGAKVGLFCISKPDVRTGGYADFDWFRITP